MVGIDTGRGSRRKQPPAHRAGPIRSESPPDTASHREQSLALTALRVEHERQTLLAERRDRWSDAAIATTSTLLRGIETRPLLVLASAVRAVAGADTVTVVRALGDPAALIVVAATGTTNPFVAGDAVPLTDTPSGGVFRGGHPRLLPQGPLGQGAGILEELRGPAMTVPMQSADRVVGAFLVTRTHGRPAFEESDLEQLALFVDHATVAIELAEARIGRERGALLEERARIARDLHDTAIQQLYAAGLELRATAAGLAAGSVPDGLTRALHLVDGAIGQIRTVVLALSPDPDGASLRARVLEMVRGVEHSFGAPPRVGFDGPIELVEPGPLAEDVLAVVRESLTNVAKHASAHHVTAAIRVIDGSVEVEVWDDGVGMPGRPPRSGLDNLAERARAREGDFSITFDCPGTAVVWRVPLPTRAELT
ncbi:GAF domain-containing sensor histidine kinase [Amnibacterium kyonggiense]|uniref:GAF domain-containing protein n=1 Tax=Amnibacterium kyonggiense TaxID=595671 RepID=A0A4R7FQP7_9MICO|nr:histidine kinase [Amnibacterium kyonggiense]TDS80008.1 GAF domain-containing protein [Amnibacterium kyonggiense]